MKKRDKIGKNKNRSWDIQEKMLILLDKSNCIKNQR